MLVGMLTALGLSAQAQRVVPADAQEALQAVPLNQEIVERPGPATPSLPPVGTQVVSNITATQIGQATNAFSSLSTGVNQLSHITSANFMVAIYRHDLNTCGGESGHYRYSFSTDLGATWDIGAAGTDPTACYGYGRLNNAFQETGRFPNVIAHLPTGQTLADSIDLIFTGRHFPLGGGLPWTGCLFGTVDDATNWVSETNNVVQENYPMASTEDEGSTNLVERVPGEYWVPSSTLSGTPALDGNVNLWKGVYNNTTGVVDWSVATTLTPNSFEPTAADVNRVISNAVMGFSPDGQDGIVAWLGDLAAPAGSPFGSDSALTIVYSRTSDGGNTWGPVEEINMLSYPNLIDSLQSFWINVLTATGDTVPSSAGVPTTGFDLDLTVDANGNPHVIVLVGSAATNLADGTINFPPTYSIFSGLRKFVIDWTIDPAGDWNGIVLGSPATFRGEFVGISVDPYVQASRSEDGTKVFLSWTDTDTTGNFGTDDNLNPDLFGRMIDVNTSQISPTINWTDGDANWDGAALMPTVDPIALFDGTATYTVPTMVSSFTDGLATTGYWYFSNIAYGNSSTTLPIDYLSNCFQSTLADAPTVTEPNCGNSDGVINPNITGGVAPFTYSWNTGATSASLTGLNPGTYSYVVTDAEGCSVSGEILLESASPVTATPQVISDISCAGLSDGSAALEMADGTAPYSFVWGNGETDSIATQLPAGTTTVEVTDAAGCVIFAEVAVSEPAALVVDDVTDGVVTCFGDSDGEVSAAASGGTGNLSYSWDDGSTGATVSNLPAGTYEVTVTDENGCTATQNATVAQPAALGPQLIAIPAFSPNSGSITIDPTNGPGNGPEYTYTISLDNVLGLPPADPFDTTFTSLNPNGEAFIGLCGGTYTVIVEDVKGCLDTGSVTVEASPNAYCAQADTTTAINGTKGLSRFNVYPNPAEGMLQVELELVEMGDLVLEVVNTQGEAVATRRVSRVPSYQTTFDLSHVAGGMYLLRVTTSQGTQSTKVMLR